MRVAVAARARCGQHVANNGDALTSTDHMGARRRDQLAVAVNASIHPLGNGEWWEPCGKSQLVEVIQRWCIGGDERHHECGGGAGVRHEFRARQTHAQHGVDLLRLVGEIKDGVSADRRWYPGGAWTNPMLQDCGDPLWLAVQMERLRRPPRILHTEGDRCGAASRYKTAGARKLPIVKVGKSMCGDPTITSDERSHQLTIARRRNLNRRRAHQSIRVMPSSARSSTRGAVICTPLVTPRAANGAPRCAAALFTASTRLVSSAPLMSLADDPAIR